MKYKLELFFILALLALFAGAFLTDADKAGVHSAVNACLIVSAGVAALMAGILLLVKYGENRG